MTPQTDLLTAEARDLLDHGASIADAEPFEVDGGGTDEFTEPETHAIDYLEEHAITLHRTSPGRLTFKLPDAYAPHVPIMVKVARYREDDHAGALQNEREHAVWQEATDELHDVLAPVFDIGEDNGWVAMPFATPVEDEVVSDVRSRLADTTLDETQFNADHIGRIDGYDDPVVVDYGHV